MLSLAPPGRTEKSFTTTADLGLKANSVLYLKLLAWIVNYLPISPKSKVEYLWWVALKFDQISDLM